MPVRARLVRPAENKVGFAALIDEQCGRLGLRTADGLPDRRALSAACGLQVTTLNLAIMRPGRPSTKTLVALEQVTGVPVDRWLEALGLMTPGVRVETLSPAERRLLAFARRRGDAWINRTVDWLAADDAYLDDRDSDR